MIKTYYFEVSKQANMGLDENGNPTEIYLKAQAPGNMTLEQVINQVAHDPIRPEFLKAITAKEYYAATEEHGQD